MIVVFIFPNGKYKGVWWMPRHKMAMKDATWRRYASGRCLVTFDPKISEWGNPTDLICNLGFNQDAHPGK